MICKGLTWRDMKIGKISVDFVNAGSMKMDGGSAFGAMPKVLWSRSQEFDEKNRVKFVFRNLLITDGTKKILVDTGIGNKLTEKQKMIFGASQFELIDSLQKIGVSPEEIDYLILTHLHFDHAGGIVSNGVEGRTLTFPNALHIIQKKEWEIAKNPDGLNRAAYNFSEDLSHLENFGKIKFIQGDQKISDSVEVIFSAGHTVGHQMVFVKNSGVSLYYPGDILASKLCLIPSVISAFDISRQESYKQKMRVLKLAKANNSIIVFNHDPLRLNLGYPKTKAIKKPLKNCSIKSSVDYFFY